MKLKILQILLFALTLIGFSHSLDEREILDGIRVGALQLNDEQCEHCNHLRAECLLVRENSKGASGKWLDAITPKRGWACTGAEDLGEQELKCQMCEREMVRYVHHMMHGQLNLDVGCICAGYMEGYFDDLASIKRAHDRAEQRVKDLKNRTQRRTHFPDLTGWKPSSKNPNNTWIKKDNHVITIIKGRENKYAVNVDGNRLGGFDHRSLRDARLAAFDHLYPPVA